MKTISLLLFFLATSVFAVRADEPLTVEVADTVVNISNPEKVVITENNSTTTISVKGCDDDGKDFNLQYVVSADTSAIEPLSIKLPFQSANRGMTRKRVERSVTFFSDFFLGVVLLYEGPQYVRTSVEVGCANVVGYRYSLPRAGASFGFGFGFGVKDFSVRRGVVPEKENDALLYVAAPEDAANVRSSLVSWSIQMPFYYRQRIYKSFTTQLSVVANFNFYTRAGSKYSIDDVEYSYKIRGLHQRGLTPDFMFSLGWEDNASFYVRWSPVKMFERQYGPQLSTLSVGVSTPF